MQRVKCVVCLVLLFFLIPLAVYGQDGGEDSTPTPAPYEEDEFAQWLQTTRRFEIVAIGSFPLTYLVTIIAYDLVKFAIESVNSGTVSALYAPLFFAPANKPPPTQMELSGILIASAVASVVVAIVDLIIQETRRARVAEKARIEAFVREQHVAHSLQLSAGNERTH